MQGQSIKNEKKKKKKKKKKPCLFTVLKLFFQMLLEIHFVLILWQTSNMAALCSKTSKVILI